MEIKSKKVLLVDDEPQIVNSMAAVIERCDCVVTTATDSERALELFKKDRPDVCIVDLHMTGSAYDGIELIIKIREIDQTVRCIILTCVPKREVPATIKGLNIYAYFEKPLSKDDFTDFFQAITESNSGEV
jgi:YesN/AraC family two-component response regulator